MKKLYAIIMLISIQASSYAASTAKVRVAARAIAQAGQTVLSAAKVNKLNTIILTSIIAFAGCAKYLYNKHDRALKQSLKQQQRLAGECRIHEACLEDLLGWKDGAKLVREYAGTTSQEVADAAKLVERKKAAADRAKQITFEAYCAGIRNGTIPTSPRLSASATIGMLSTLFGAGVPIFLTTREAARYSKIFKGTISLAILSRLWPHINYNMAYQFFFGQGTIEGIKRLGGAAVLIAYVFQTEKFPGWQIMLNDIAQVNKKHLSQVKPYVAFGLLASTYGTIRSWLDYRDQEAERAAGAVA